MTSNVSSASAKPTNRPFFPISYHAILFTHGTWGGCQNLKQLQSQTTLSLRPHGLHSLSQLLRCSPCVWSFLLSGRCSEYSLVKTLKELSLRGSANSLSSILLFRVISQDYSRQNLEGILDSALSCRKYCPLYFPHTWNLIYSFSSTSTAKAFGQAFTPSLLNYWKADHLVSQPPVPPRGIHS